MRSVVFPALVIFAGCAPMIGEANLPDKVPDCTKGKHYEMLTLEASGQFHDRQIVCLKKGDGSYAWFEVVIREIK